MSDERHDFSKRLTEAMRAAGYEPRPTVLFRLFNARYHGRSVSFQTASRWLGGRALPEQDKLRVLAALFSIDPHLLRFGDTANGVREQSAPYGITARDRRIIDSYLMLPPKRRELVGELVKALLER
ncbi:MAG: hypothetical protein QM612_08775 [Thermomonas sp.]|uniref:hypothetical protein n=1 Tax=Thermomonas sp. TaxID=1971895 RepID=UPI0039E49F77